jgi:uncharacterized protein (TIGR02996 family)
MSLDQAFLDDIIEHPDDDTPRLIYADWLEDQGNPSSRARAELIRVQCQLSANRGTQGTPRLFQRQREILAEHEQHWVQELGVSVAEWQFERGFIGRIRIEVPVLLEHAEQLFHRAPIRQLSLFWWFTRIMDRTADLRRLCSLPTWRNLLSLEMPEQHLSSAILELLASCEAFPGLQVLDLARNRLGDAGLRALAQSPLFARLVVLNLSGNDITARGIRRLVECVDSLLREGVTPRLRTLKLANNSLGANGRRAVWEHPYLSQVVRLFD